jgi:hypothetical protein
MSIDTPAQDAPGPRVETVHIPGLSGAMVLRQHDLGPGKIAAFVAEQEQALSSFSIHMAHHANIAIVRHAESGLYFVKKTYGEKKLLPSDIAAGLMADYQVHEDRLRRVGVRTAHTYNFVLTPHPGGEHALLTCYQLFLPHGTVSDWVTNDALHDDQIEAIVRAMILQTVLPVLEYTAYGALMHDDTSMIFHDAAPKNVAPLRTEHGLSVFYFDMFVPRIRMEGGEPKTYGDFPLHKRTEAEMRERFFQKKGIVLNVIKKMRDECGKDSRAWAIFRRVVQEDRMLGDYLERYFPGKTVDQVADEKIGGRVH